MLRLLVFTACFLVACLSTRASSVDVRGDTLLPADIEYQGYRLHIRQIDVVKQKGTAYLLRFDLVNTGKRSVSLGPGFPARYLQTVFDPTLQLGGLVPLAPGLRRALTKSRLELGVGAWVRDQEFWVTSDEPVQRARLQTDDFARSPAAPRRSKEDFERSTPRGASAKTKETTAVAEKPADAPCRDLAIADMRVVFQGKKSATVQLTLQNPSTQTIDFGSLPEGITVALFLSGATELSGSARRLTQIDLSSRLRHNASKSLPAGASITLVETCDTSESTRYTNILIGQLDGGQALAECDELNNQAHVLLSE